LRRDAEGTVRWFRPDGSGYRAGPGPPREGVERPTCLLGGQGLIEVA
jgi:hypothetical protein